MRKRRNVNDFIVIFMVVITMAVANQPSFADTNTPDINGLAHICVYTRDMSKSLVFYTDTLGFELVHRTRLVGGLGFTNNLAQWRMGTIMAIKTISCLRDIPNKRQMHPCCVRKLFNNKNLAVF